MNTIDAEHLAHQREWSRRERPSGFVHTLTSAVFDKPHFAENAHQGASKRHPERQYVICEIREIP